MFREEYQAAANGAAGKFKLLENNPAGYFLLSMLAGAFIGFGVLLTNTIGGTLAGSPATKTVMGCAFGVALSLVVMAGGELFTGNNMVMMAGVFKGTVTLPQAIRLWIICWIGNLAGGIVLGSVYHFSALGTGAIGDFIAAGAAAKMSAAPLALICRGMLCNMLVCLAVWCGFRCKNEAAKLMMVFWCLFAFVTTGFEHSIANMTLFTAALLEPAGQAVSIGGMFYNLVLVSIGNMIGGILLVAVPYFIAAKD